MSVQELAACPVCARWIEPDGWCKCGYRTAAAGPAEPAKPARRRMVYIAGPLGGGDVRANIEAANRAFLALACAGLAPLVPHWSAFSGEIRTTGTGGSPYAFATAGGCGLTHPEWLAVDLAFVERSDAVLRLPGESTGADMETAHAVANGIPVFRSVADVIAWKDSRRELV